MIGRSWTGFLTPSPESLHQQFKNMLDSFVVHVVNRPRVTGALIVPDRNSFSTLDVFGSSPERTRQSVGCVSASLEGRSVLQIIPGEDTYALANNVFRASCRFHGARFARPRSKHGTREQVRAAWRGRHERRGQPVAQ